MSAGDVNIYAGRNAAWHLQGGVRPEGWRNSRLAGLDTGLVQTDYVTGRIKVELPNGEWIDFPDRLGIVRGPVAQTPYQVTDMSTWMPLEVVGKHYGLVTPEDVCNALMAVSDMDALGDKAWPVETMGLLDNGYRMFAALKIGRTHLFSPGSGEDTDWYLFVGQRFGKGGISVTVTPVTVVCKNTWYMAHQNNTGLIKIAHTQDAKSMLDFAVAVERAVVERKAGAEEWLTALVNKEIDPVDVRFILESTWPDPKPNGKAQKMKEARAAGLADAVSDESWNASHKKHTVADKAYENAMARMRVRREGALAMLEFYDNNRHGGAGTLYGLAGAFGEFIERDVTLRRKLDETADSLLNTRGDRHAEYARMIQATNKVLSGKYDRDAVKLPQLFTMS